MDSDDPRVLYFYQLHYKTSFYNIFPDPSCQLTHHFKAPLAVLRLPATIMLGAYDTHSTADILVRDYAGEIKGKVILITGTSPNSLGAFFVEHVAAARPKLLILAGRNPTKLQATADAVSRVNPNVQMRTLQLDLESITQIKEACTEVNSWDDVPHIDVLVNNAGVMACPYAKTEDGLERQFAAGHVGPFIFTNLILKKVLASNAPRIVNVSSNGHRLSAMRWGDLGFAVRLSSSKWQHHGCPDEHLTNGVIGWQAVQQVASLWSG